ncbi:c-type cytochrome [Roseibium algae]|uniref:C-type cytochrome n=1 Tax=Roseibium algae TaxID=3123038 RepID=A0ABU8TKV9_9HYPH
MLRALFLGLGGVFLAQAVFVSAAVAEVPLGDPAAGRKAAGMCRTCHGIDGFAKIPIAPHIGGEPAPYLVHQLIAFRNGTRTHEMMSVVAKSLTDQAIVDLAAWYASQKAVASLPAGVSEDAAPEACAACHGAEGLSQMEDVPNLAGETTMYIDTQLKAFRNGKRSHEIMSEISAELSSDQIRSLAEWYAAVNLEIKPPE